MVEMFGHRLVGIDALHLAHDRRSRRLSGSAAFHPDEQAVFEAARIWAA